MTFAGERKLADDIARRLRANAWRDSRQSSTQLLADISLVGAVGSIVEIYTHFDAPLPDLIAESVHQIAEHFGYPEALPPASETLSPAQAHQFINRIKREEIGPRVDRAREAGTIPTDPDEVDAE